MDMLFCPIMNVGAAVCVPDVIFKPKATYRFNDFCLGFPEERVVDAHTLPEDLVQEPCE